MYENVLNNKIRVHIFFAHFYVSHPLRINLTSTKKINANWKWPSVLDKDLKFRPYQVKISEFENNKEE
jgi:hypothetical protein